MDANDAVRALEDAGIRLKGRGRLANDLGEQIRCDGGAVVNVFDSGTIQVQGKKDVADRVKAILGVDQNVRPAPATNLPTGRNVFVVYGHDTAARTQLEAMLRRWRLEPLILDQLPSEGQTIIEKLERYTDNDVRFAVVLATPDDVGYKHEHEDEKKYRARQNVVLELGLMLAKLGRPRVAIIIKDQDNMERPSDIQGLIYLPFRNNVEEIGLSLAKEMNSQGLTIDVKRI